MSTGEQNPVSVTATDDIQATEGSEKTVVATSDISTTEPVIEQERAEKLLLAKELYSHGSRNYLVKSYAEAADELSQVCALYEELYGEQSDELGMPYLLYAKSLIALALDENKVIDVPDEEELEEDDDDDDDGEGEDGAGDVENGAGAVGDGKKERKASTGKKNGAASSSSNGSAPKAAALNAIKENAEVAEVDSTEKEETAAKSNENKGDKSAADNGNGKSAEDGVVGGSSEADSNNDKENEKEKKNGSKAEKGATTATAGVPILDDEKPSTSNGDADAGEEDDEEENEAASNLQLAWEILELAAKIFTRQGTNGLPNLAEVQTELANIEFENNLPEAAREDYARALKIYSALPSNYHRAMAEIHYKIGLTYLMQQLNNEGAESLKDACTLIDAEILELQESVEGELSEKQKNNIQDMEETKQEILAKITEIEETQAQNVAEVRAALDSYIKPINAEHKNDAEASSSSSSSAAAATAGGSSSASAAKPTDISHLIKRKKPDEQSCEVDSTASPAKRPAV